MNWQIKENAKMTLRKDIYRIKQDYKSCKLVIVLNQ